MARICAPVLALTLSFAPVLSTLCSSWCDRHIAAHACEHSDAAATQSTLTADRPCPEEAPVIAAVLKDAIGGTVYRDQAAVLATFNAVPAPATVNGHGPSWALPSGPPSRCPLTTVLRI
jgi:hypothetical protein